MERGAGVGVATVTPQGSDLPGPDLLDQDPLPAGFTNHFTPRKRSPHPFAQSVSDGCVTTSEHANSPPFGTENTRLVACALTTDASSTTTDEPSATTGTKRPVARTDPDTTYTNAPVVENSHMERRSAVSHRKAHLLTPLVVDKWLEALDTANLLDRYKSIPVSI